MQYVLKYISDKGYIFYWEGGNWEGAPILTPDINAAKHMNYEKACETQKRFSFSNFTIEEYTP